MGATRRPSPVGNLPASRFAVALRTRRANLAITQSDLAESLGVRTQTISQWERSAKQPQPRFYDTLVSFLGLADREQLRDLLGFSGASRHTQARGKGPVIVGIDWSGLRLVQTADGECADDQSIHAESMNLNHEVVAAVVSVIQARDGQLSDEEIRLMQSLLTAAHPARVDS